MTEFSVRMANRPGKLAALAGELGEAGVNIEALAAFAMDSEGIVRLMVDDEDKTRGVLRRSGIPFDERAVLTTTLRNEPGALANMANELASSGVNISAMYLVHASADGLHFAIAVDETA